MTLKELNEFAKELGVSENTELRIDAHNNEKLWHCYTDKKQSFLSLCSKSDMDLYDEILSMRDYYEEHQLDELDFFMELLAKDITIDDIAREFKDDELEGDFYPYAKKFMEEHGLI